jgi:hypothetical protein
MTYTVHRHKNSPYYQTDIWIDGVKFPRSTGKTSKSEARRRAAEIEKELRKQHEQAKISEESLAGKHTQDVLNLLKQEVLAYQSEMLEQAATAKKAGDSNLQFAATTAAVAAQSFVWMINAHIQKEQVQ